MERLRRWGPVTAIAIIIAVIVGIYYYRIFEFQWWVPGAYLYDTELFNYIIGPKGQGLRLPALINEPSFFIWHVSPILLPFSSISTLLGLKEMQPLELVLLIGFSGVSVAAFIVMDIYLRPIGRWTALALAALFALAYALSGIMRTTASYPHIEILYPPLAAVSLLMIFHRHKRWAWLPFMACLFVREDTGLHMACIFGAYLVLAALSERKIPRRTLDILPFLGVSILYPVVAIWAQNTFQTINSNFARIYSGTPPYVHLTTALLHDRFHTLLTDQPQAIGALGAAAAAFALRPRWTALTGLLAGIPWFLVSITAFSDAAGNLMLYYAFPFLPLVLAPFIVTADLPEPEDAYVPHL